MPFPDDRRPASFRGVPFGVSEVETPGLARRTQVHEYPERDDAYVEDLGRQTTRFDLVAWVAGPDYQVQRDALIAACAEPGPGQLVHPTYGERTVSCVDCSARETWSRGEASFSLSFVLAGSNRFPSATPFSKGLIEDRAGAASTTVGDTFGRLWGVTDVVQWVYEDGSEIVVAAHAAMSAAVRSVPKGEDPDLGAVTRDLAILAEASATLLGDPGGLASQIASVIRTVATVSAGPLGTIRILEDLARFGDDLDPGSNSTASRARAQANQRAMMALVRRNAAIEAARAVPDAELASYGDAVELRDRLEALLDTEITSAADQLQDEDAEALRTLRAEVVRDLTLRGGPLARVQTFVPIDTVPAVVIAQRLYGDALRADEIIARNTVIEHPGFVVGGTELEVLSA